MMLPATEAHSPSGWTALRDDANTQFFFPHVNDSSTFVAIFPTVQSTGTLPHTLAALWHKTIGNEHLVDAEQKQLVTADGAPALLEIVASVDEANRAIYRVFVVKQYGSEIASGEFRSNDPEKMKALGDAALTMLETMSITAHAGSAATSTFSP
jgi:hypothetical protein